MRKVLALGVMLALGVVGVHAQSAGIRQVTSSDAKVETVHTRVRYSTMIVLPDGDEIVDVICGDQEFWRIDPILNIAHVKPAKEGAQTNLNLVTTSGAIYSFLLVEGKGGLTPDLRVNVLPDPNRTTQAPPKYYTARQWDGLQEELERAQEATEAAQRIAEQRIAEARASLPAAIQFPYDIDLDEKPFLIRAAWSDGQFTYFRSDAQELPALYELKDGKPALVTFSVENGTYIVNKPLDEGYFTIGAKRLGFKVRP